VVLRIDTLVSACAEDRAAPLGVQGRLGSV
jgi:hypothetical protein